jgi:LysM repeat protein
MRHQQYRIFILIGIIIPVLLGSCKGEDPAPISGRGQVRSIPEPAATSMGRPDTPTAVPSPSPPYAGSYVGTPTPHPTPAGYATRTAVETYVVQAGETLSLIAAVFGCTVEEIVAANDLPNANSIAVGQTLVIPVAASLTGSNLKLLPDSEMVYGPAYIHFDLPAFIAGRGGYLTGYTEQVEGRTLTGVEIVELVSQRFSVGPRALLTLLEMQSGWVTQPQPAQETLVYPLGDMRDYHEGLFHQLSAAAVWLNEGYYGWKGGSRVTIQLSTGVRVNLAPDINPGTAGVQNCMAQLAPGWDAWVAAVGPEGFLATYEELFGNPFAFAVEPLVPADLAQPEMRLPWEAGRTWYFTGGPHGGWGEGSGRAALDFVPGEEQLGCTVSSEWATALAPGLVVRSGDGQVLLDLDGDGFEQSGWVVLYLHVYEADRVAAGTYLQRGERIGHPSCEGGAAEATHLHLARRYNGEWIPAGSGALPMELSGWVAQADRAAYEGTLVRGDEQRTACECWEAEINGLRSDNAPASES